MSRSALALLLCLLCLGAPAGAQQMFRIETEGKKGPLEVTADTLGAVQGGSVITGKGNVVLVWEGNRLTSDEATYDRESSKLTAEGSVVLQDGDGNVLRCKSLVFDTSAQEGTVVDGTLWIAREGYRIWGKHFRKTGPQTYHVEEGGFTPCDGSWPSWRVNADVLDVELEKYLRAHHATFWVEGIPTAYLPYVVFPVKRLRQSGFLFPRVGLSSSDGFILGTRYYWAFSDSADLTARLEYRSKRGWTEEADLRYALAEGHEGRLDVTHLYDKKNREDRFTVVADHLSKFDDANRVKLHVDYVGDKKLLQDTGDTLDQRGEARKEDSLLATHEEDPGTVYALARYVQALQESQGPVLQTLPQVGIEGRETPVAGPLSVSPTVNFTNYYRRDGVDGERLELNPGLAWDSRFGGLGVAARTGYRQNLYRLDSDWSSRGAAWAGLDLSATLARRYGTDYVHTIEPKIAWFWQEPGRGTDPPVFDPTDVFQSGAWLAFLVESRLLRARDLKPLAGLDVAKRFGLGSTGGDVPTWGATDAWWAKGTFTPVDAFSLRGEMTVDPGLKYPWLQWSVDLETKDPRGDILKLGYHYLKEWASYLDAGVEIPVAPALSVQYRNRYSYADRRCLEQGVGLHLLHECWELLFTFSRNLRTDESGYEHRFFVTAQLKGLGNLGVLRGILQ